MNAKLTKTLFDLGVLAGAAAFVYGLWLAWRPLGWTVAGLLVGAACFLSGYDRERRAMLDRMRKGAH